MTEQMPDGIPMDLEPIEDWTSIDPEAPTLVALPEEQIDALDDFDPTDTSPVVDPDEVVKTMVIWETVEVWGRKAGTTDDFTFLSSAAHGETLAVMEGLPEGETWEIRARAIAADGRTSEWSAIETITLPTDNQPPPVLSKPNLTQSFGVVHIRWDGLGHNAQSMPADFAYARIEARMQGETEWEAEGTFLQAGTFSLPGLPAGTVEVRLVGVDTTPNESDPSEVATIAVEPIESAEAVRDELREATEQAERDLALLDEALRDAFVTADTAVLNAAKGDAASRAEAAKSEAIQAAVGEAQGLFDTANSAAAAAAQAASDAAGLAGTKADVLIQSTAPPAAMRKSTTLWIDTTGGNNTPKRWTSGTTWVAVTDKKAADAATAAANAATAASAAQTAAENAHTAAGNAWNYADSAMTRAGTAETNAKAHADSVAATAKTNAENAAKAYTDSQATDSVNLFDNGDMSRGKTANWLLLPPVKVDGDRNYTSVRYAWTVRFEAPLSGGAYTLSTDVRNASESSTARVRWAIAGHDASDTQVLSNSVYADLAPGPGWQRVSATQTFPEGTTVARIYLLNADSTGNAVLDFGNLKIERGQRATDWSPSAGDVAAVRARAEEAITAAANAEANAKNHADALPKVLHGTGLPTGTAPDGSIWWRHKDTIRGAVIGQWNRVAGKWESTPIDSEAIANLDVGKLTAGSADIDTAVVSKLFADIFRANKITARQLILSPGNLFSDPEFADPVGYGSWTAKNGGLERNGAAASTAVELDEWSVRAQPGDVYRMSFVRTNLAGSTGSVSMTARSYDASGAQLSYLIVAKATTAGLASGMFTVPDSAVRVKFGFFLDAAVATSTKVRITNPAVVQAVDASLIVDGSVTAKKMNFVRDGSKARLMLNENGLILESNRADGAEVMRIDGESPFTISVFDPDDGTAVASIGEDGSVNSTSSHVGDELTWRGTSMDEYFWNMPWGIRYRGLRGTSPASSSSSSTHVQPFMRLEWQALKGRQYEVRVFNVTLTANSDAIKGRMMIREATGGFGNGIRATMASSVACTNYTGRRLASNASHLGTYEIKYKYVATENRDVSNLFCWSAWGGTGSVNISTSGSDPVYFEVVDLGPHWDMETSGHDTIPSPSPVVPPTAVSLDGGPSEGSADPSPPPAESRTYVDTWAAASTAYWRNGTRNTGQMIQGYTAYDSSGGTKEALAVFGSGTRYGQTMATALSGATVEKIEVYLYFDHWHSAGGGTAGIALHGTHGTLPASSTLGGIVKSTSFKRGEGKWITLPSTYWAGFKNGTYRGFGIKAASTASAYYGTAYGKTGNWKSPKIRITYTK